MISRERVCLMTQMAAYEEGEGRYNRDVANYFRSDYVSIKLLGSFLGATLAFLIVMAGYIFYHFEEIMRDIYQLDIMDLGKRILIAYVVFVGIYCLIAFFYYSYRYSRARKNLKEYSSHLQELRSLYDL